MATREYEITLEVVDALGKHRIIGQGCDVNGDPQIALQLALEDLKKGGWWQTATHEGNFRQEIIVSGLVRNNQE